MKKKIGILMIGIILVAFVSPKCFASERTTLPIDETLAKSFEYYVGIVLQYCATLAGVLTALIVVFKKIKRLLLEVKNGTGEIEKANNELKKQQKQLDSEKEFLLNASESLKSAIKNQEQFDSYMENINKIKEALRVMVSNDSSLVSSGVAKEIASILKENDKDVEQK